jgi:hypothetical protein
MAFIRVNFCFFHTVRNTKTKDEISIHIYLPLGVDDISQRLSKLIRKALQEQEEEQLEPKDLKSAAKAIY